MSQQINLYDPALLRKRELLTAASLAAVALLLLAGVGGWGALAHAQLAGLQSEVSALEPQFNTLQEQVVTTGKQLASVKPDPRLETELAAARSTLSLRADVVAALKKGLGAESASFAEYLRGLSRQSVTGLWLTGFVISENGEMEIHGRMIDAAQLPEYIRRLNSEKAFQGRAFAALNVSAGTAAATDATSALATVGTTATTHKAAPYLDFALTPVLGGLSQDAAGNSPQKVAAAPPEGKR